MTKVQYIKTNSPEYPLICQLRYQTFFEEHNLPWEILFDELEPISFHCVIKSEKPNQILAYGRLTPIAKQEYRISQMVVASFAQGQGWGRKIMQGLIDKAQTHAAKAITLEARRECYWILPQIWVCHY